MIVGIGILTYNNEETIKTTLKSIFNQTLFTEKQEQIDYIHIACVPNGCTDKTKKIATSNLERFTKNNYKNKVIYDVLPIDKKSKSNAWNHCIHLCLDEKCDYIFMIDADIDLDNQQTLTKMLDLISKTHRLNVVIDNPIKKERINNKIFKYLFKKLETKKPGFSICGQFYCIKGDIARNIWMLPDLPVEDVFLRAMIITSNLTKKEDRKLIKSAEGASHFYYGDKSIRRTYHYRKRFLLGGAINLFLLTHIHQNYKWENASQIIKNQMDADPEWYSKIIKKYTSSKRWLIPKKLILRRFYDLKFNPDMEFRLNKKISNIPIAVIDSIFSLLVSIDANNELKKGKGVEFW